jgi:O-succinylbenzoate synthase
MNQKKYSQTLSVLSMTIKKAELFIVELPLIHPFSLSFGTIKKRSTIIIKLTSDDGLVGWGEAAPLPVPLYSYETVDVDTLILKQYLIPAVLGKSFDSAQQFRASYVHVRGYNFAKSGLESAFWSLLSLQKNIPLAKLLGGKRAEIAVGESIGIHPTIKETLAEIELRLSEGYRRTKVKIKPGWDTKLVDAIRKEFGDIPLMVDGNSAYTLSDSTVFENLDQYGLMMIEQPLGDTDIIDHASLQVKLKTPLCLDESILSAEDARKAIEIGACGIINIKPGRVGGLVESIAIHNICAQKNIPVWCGGMLESGIGRAANIAVSTLDNFSLPADMSPSSVFYTEDIIDPTYTVSKKGFIDVPQTAGLGFAVSQQRLSKYTRSHITL